MLIGEGVAGCVLGVPTPQSRPSTAAADHPGSPPAKLMTAHPHTASDIAW